MLVCILALVVQHADRVFSAFCYIAICGLSGCDIFFSHCLTNGTIFRKKLSNIKCVFWFSLQPLSETFILLGRIQRGIIINVHRSSCTIPDILVGLKICGSVHHA